MYRIGIDIGGMSIKAGIVKDGKIISTKTKVTRVDGILDTLIDDLSDLINGILNENGIEIDKVEKIGVGFPGVVTNNGYVTCVNLKLINQPVLDKLNDKFKNIKVSIANDANVAALAEYRHGSMKGFESGVMITLGTGVGGGVVINDRLISGANGIGAELGHLIIGENYYDCNCGNNGCFETFCSATAIINYAKKLIEENKDCKLYQVCEGNLDNLTAKMVFDLYKEKDEISIEVINRFKKYLAIGIANIVNFIDPDVVSIGGGVSNASNIILDNLSDEVKKHLPFKESNICDIVIAKFKNDAGILGASEL